MRHAPIACTNSVFRGKLVSSSRGGIAGVYQRHDWAAEKRAALDAWATHVRSIVEGRIDGTNVVKMPRNA